MGAVAAAMRNQGYTVTGSDAGIYPPMSTFLESKGITLSEGYRAENLPETADLIVVGNAISRGNPELEAVLNRKLYYLSLPETLKQFFLRGKHNLVVTGTHGKTTTTALLTWIMQSAGLNPAYMIGGIAKNLGQGASLHESKYVTIEGDEYDTAFFDKRSKFVHYLPELVIVNNIEFDHADIFDSLDAIKISFRRLLNIVPEVGMVLINGDDPNCIDVAENCRAQLLEVGFSPNAARHIRDVSYDAHGSEFTLLDTRFRVPMVGEFNVRNAAMAISAAHFYGVSLEAAARAVAEFGGVKRRQEVRGTVRGMTIIDDFGHHPTAIAATLRGLRHQYPGQRLWALFEPRSNTTRRAVFQQSLPEALQEADGVILAQVARIDQIDPANRLDPERVVADIVTAGREAYYEPDVDAIVTRLKPLVREGDVIVILSNGGFGGIHERLLKEL
ncbi:MAG: UDP-N-acetylmuramate [Chthoniobacter sp.]|nr:UDP-N-acetylmuramate [Chthoniobacter sp.]